MKQAMLLHQLLEIEHPWLVTEVRYDPRRRKVDVWVQENSARNGWFARRLVPAHSGGEHVWRHVDLAGLTCYIHLRAASGQALPRHSWCGDGDTPFTGALALRVAALLAEGISLPSVCSLLNLSINELWKFKFGLESGRMRVSGHLPAAQREEPEAEPGGVPSALHPVWERLLEGSLELDIRVLSLKLLLARLREQMRRIQDPAVRQMKVQEVHHYFTRYAPLLKEELQQMHQAIALGNGRPS